MKKRHKLPKVKKSKSIVTLNSSTFPVVWKEYSSLLKPVAKTVKRTRKQQEIWESAYKLGLDTGITRGRDQVIEEIKNVLGTEEPEYKDCYC